MYVGGPAVGLGVIRVGWVACVEYNAQEGTDALYDSRGNANAESYGLNHSLNY